MTPLLATIAPLIAAWLASFSGQVPINCTPEDPYTLVVEAHSTEGAPVGCLRVPVVTKCGFPHTLSWVIHDEAQSIPCNDIPEGEVRSISVAEVYPESIVGLVGRHEVTTGDYTIPEVTPKWFVCQGPGCYCAGTADQCEHLPVGGPDGYWLTRLCRLNSESELCP